MGGGSHASDPAPGFSESITIITEANVLISIPKIKLIFNGIYSSIPHTAERSVKIFLSLQT